MIRTIKFVDAPLSDVPKGCIFMIGDELCAVMHSQKIEGEELNCYKIFVCIIGFYDRGYIRETAAGATRALWSNQIVQILREVQETVKNG